MNTTPNQFHVDHLSFARSCSGVFFAMAWMAFSAAQAQTINYALGTSNLLVGPTTGTNSVVLAVTPASGTWTAAANTNWLHLSVANQSGTGSTNVIFSFDVNPGSTRSGSLTVAGQTVTVTQAGSTYVAVGNPTTLALFGGDLPYCLAVDGMGDVYVANPYAGAIQKWTLTNNSLSTLVGSLYGPQAVAASVAGNVYISDTGNNVIKEFTQANDKLTTLVSTGLSDPCGLAVDGAGNVYIADSFNGALKRWAAFNSNVTTLVSNGLNLPIGVSVDVAGNVYIADVNDNAIKVWFPATGDLTALVSSGLNFPEGVAVDGSGNVYIADTYNWLIKKWTAANSTVTTFGSLIVNHPQDVAVDAAGNLYIADTYDNVIEELPHAFVDPTLKLESASAGSDSLPEVLPVTANLLPPFAPTTDQPWLAISGITNGVVRFSFAANPGAGRVAHIMLLGQAIPVVQVAFASPLILTALPTQGNGMFQLAFGAPQSSSFTVISTTNLSLPLTNWIIVGPASNIGTNLFQFTDTNLATDEQRYYYVRSP
jgi:sugar lactone lactonase YvrE